MNYPPLWSDKVEQRVREDARNLDQQERPADVQFCKRCVLSSQRPRITFVNGVCSACLYAEEKKHGIDWLYREKQLNDLLDRHRKRHGYDCIVPCSGGKDSAFVAHRLKHEYHMNPLCINWAPAMMTDIGRQNLDAFIHHGFDVITMQPNGLIHRKLARLGLEYYGDPFLPFIYGQLAWPMNAAKFFGIKLVFFGENGEAEYGGDTAANEKPCWDQGDWERIYKKGAGVERLREIGEAVGAFSKEDNFSPFYTPPDREIDGPEFHWMGYYTPWTPQQNYYYAAEHTGFQANDSRSVGTYSKYASIDDKLDGLHYWLGYLKFGLGRASSDAAHEIRDGHIDREEAIALVKHYDHEFPSRYFDECRDYLGLSGDSGRHHWTAIENRFRAPHLWENIPQGWKLKHTVYD